MITDLDWSGRDRHDLSLHVHCVSGQINQHIDLITLDTLRYLLVVHPVQIHKLIAPSFDHGTHLRGEGRHVLRVNSFL